MGVAKQERKARSNRALLEDLKPLMRPGPEPPPVPEVETKPKEPCDEYPDRWHDSFWVYAKGSASICGRAAQFMTEDQWTEMRRLILRGYPVGFSAGPDGAPDIACQVGKRMSDVDIGAIYDQRDGTVYFLKCKSASK